MPTPTTVNEVLFQLDERDFGVMLELIQEIDHDCPVFLHDARWYLYTPEKMNDVLQLVNRSDVIYKVRIHCASQISDAQKLLLTESLISVSREDYWPRRLKAKCDNLTTAEDTALSGY